MLDATGPTAFVLAGGGSLGAVQVGMLRALLGAGVRPDFVVGTSVGAINAAAFASDPTPRGVDRLEAIWRGMRRSTVFPVSPLRGVLGLFARSDSLVDPGPLAALVRAHLGFDRLERAPLPCHVIAADLADGSEVLLSAGPAVPALLASAAIPGVFPPVDVAGRRLVDGGITSNAPVAAAAMLGAARVVVLPTGTPCALDEPPRGPLAIALQSLSLMIARQLADDVERVTDSCRVDVIPPLCPLAIAVHDFSHGDDLIERGERVTREWLAQDESERARSRGWLAPHTHAVPPDSKIDPG